MVLLRSSAAAAGKSGCRIWLFGESPNLIQVRTPTSEHPDNIEVGESTQFNAALALSYPSRRSASPALLPDDALTGTWDRHVD